MSETSPCKPTGIVSSKSSQIVLSGVVVDATAGDKPFVVINYSVIPGNDPVKYKNWAGFWQDNKGNFWEDEPIASSRALDDTSRQITIPLEEFLYGTYYAGYYCDQESQEPRGAPCATLTFNGSYEGSNPFSCSIVPLGYDGGVLTIQYDTPVGNNPGKNGNYIALCEGSVPLWDNSWKHTFPIDSGKASGTLTWSVGLKPGGTYTIAYINGEGSHNIAAINVFTLPK